MNLVKRIRTYLKEKPNHLRKNIFWMITSAKKCFLDDNRISCYFQQNVVFYLKSFLGCNHQNHPTILLSSKVLISSKNLFCSSQEKTGPVKSRKKQVDDAKEPNGDKVTLKGTKNFLIKAFTSFKVAVNKLWKSVGFQNPPTKP